MSDFTHAALLTAFPVAAAGVGACIAALRRPSGRVMSSVQHFAAGVVIAALVGEVLPDLRDEGHWSWAVAGFALGVAAVLTLGAWGRSLDRRADTSPTDASAELTAEGTAGDAVALSARLPVGMIAAVAIDLLIDGALVGLGVTLGPTQAAILTGALTIEILFLALSVQGELADDGMPTWRAAGLSAGLGLMTAIGAIASAAALTNAGAGPIAAMLAFGAAALLYLAVEELLVEAHEESETVVSTAMFFLGFLVIYGLAQIGG